MESLGFPLESSALRADKWDSVLEESSVSWVPLGYLLNNESLFLASGESLLLLGVSQSELALLGIRLRSRFITFRTLSTILSSQDCCIIRNHIYNYIYIHTRSSIGSL